MLPIQIVLLNIDCKPQCSVTNTNAKPTSFVIHYKNKLKMKRLNSRKLGRGGGFTILPLLSLKYWFSIQIQLALTIFHHKFMTREHRILANGWTHPSSMTIFVNLFIRNVIQKVTIVTLNAIASVVGTYEPYPARFPLHLGRFVLIHSRLGGRVAYMETHP